MIKIELEDQDWVRLMDIVTSAPIAWKIVDPFVQEVRRQIIAQQNKEPDSDV